MEYLFIEYNMELNVYKWTIKIEKYNAIWC